MKKVFLLVAAVGMFGVMNAQTYKSFKASTEEVVVDQADGATTAEFTVTLNGEPAKLIASPTVKVWNGTGYESTPVVDVNTVDAATGKYSVSLTTNGLAKTAGATKYVIEFAEGSFTNADASIESNKLSLRLVVLPTATFTAGQTFYLETGVKEGDLEIEVVATTAEEGMYTNNEIVGLDDSLVPTGMSAKVENGKGYLTISEDLYETWLPVCTPDNMNIPAGLFKTAASTNNGTETYTVDIHDIFVFTPSVIGTYDNKATELKFQFDFNPRAGAQYGSYEHGTAGITCVSRDEFNAGNQADGDVHVNYIKLDGDDTEYPVTEVQAGKYTVDLGDADALNAFVGGTATFKVYGDFYAENTHATESAAAASFAVAQKEEDGLEVTDLLIKAADNTDKLDLDYVEITFPDGISLNADELVVPVNVINLAYGSDVHWVKSIKPVTEGSNNYIVEFENPLTLGNQYILNIPAGQLKGLGDDNIMYKNAEEVNLAVSVKHVFNFNDNFGETPVTTLATEVVADTYDFVQYNRTYTGKMEALYLPFDVDLETATVKVGDAYEPIADHFTFYKIYAFTNDGTSSGTKLHVAENTVLHANMPYLVMAHSAGDKTIYMEDATIVAPADDNNGVEVKSETVYERFYFYGKTEKNTVGSYGLSGTVMAVSKSGSIAKAGASATLKAWRWLLNVKNKSGITEENYAKGIEIVIDDEATAIQTVNVENVANGVIYNANGQKISAPIKDQLFIQNGKKFIAK